MGQPVGETGQNPTVQLTELAALKLKLFMYDVKEHERLSFRVTPMTCGCGSPSFQLDLAEPSADEHLFYLNGVPFRYKEGDLVFLNGLRIDLNRKNGSLELTNLSYQPEQHCCSPDRPSC